MDRLVDLEGINRFYYIGTPCKGDRSKYAQKKNTHAIGKHKRYFDLPADDGFSFFSLIYSEYQVL